MNRTVRIGLILLTILLLPLWAFAQQTGHQHGQQPAAAAAKTEKAAEAPAVEGGAHHKMHHMGMSEEMKARHEKMAAEMKAMDARLDEKLAALKNAKGNDQKIGALEAVVVELAAQRKEMHKMMGEMHHGMMGGMKCGMMGKMMEGDEGEHGEMHHGGGGMKDCEMMKGHGEHGEHGDKPAEAPKEDAGKKSN